jgi:Transcription factor Iwr1
LANTDAINKDLENDRHQSKRRFTDYCFQRVKKDREASPLLKSSPADTARETQRAASSHAASGIPTVRATSPGTEIRDEAQRMAAQKALRDRYLPVKDACKQDTSASPTTPKDDVPEQEMRPVAPLRKFHLYRGARMSQSNYPLGIQKRKIARRNHLATFVERSVLSKRGPDLLDDFAQKQAAAGLQERRLKSSASGQPLDENPNTLPRQTSKAGQSLDDHPSTWDYESDQLAEELAAFALELSQNEKRDAPFGKIVVDGDASNKDESMNMDDEFIYDTYIRIPISDGKGGDEPTKDVGVLVIEDEDQELWKTFAETDDDSEWDEDDPDSNGSCSSDYLSTLLMVSSRGQSCQ